MILAYKMSKIEKKDSESNSAFLVFKIRFIASVAFIKLNFNTYVTENDMGFDLFFCFCSIDQKNTIASEDFFDFLDNIF